MSSHCWIIGAVRATREGTVNGCPSARTVAFTPSGDAKKMTVAVHAHGGSPDNGLCINRAAPEAKLFPQTVTLIFGQCCDEGHGSVDHHDHKCGQPDGHIVGCGEAETKVNEPYKAKL